MDLKQGNSSVSRFSTSLCSFIIPVDNYRSEQCGCLAWECLCIAPKLHIPVHKEWNKVWMWTSLLVSQATTHILIENNQITAFPSTNKLQCITVLIEGGRAEMPGATTGIGHNTLREHTRVHTHARPTPGLCFFPPQFCQGCCSWLQDRASHFPSFDFAFYPGSSLLAAAGELQLSATMIEQLFLSPPQTLRNVI